ncbi:hypothetical protein N9H61_05770 [Schleiferiaceae bacterium]|jgi:hypothetical protein|nr:hypothetical protein [Schleiferiaceae bacterium]
MRTLSILLFALLSLNLFAQSGNYYLVVDDTAAVGMYSERYGLTFTEELDEKVMSNIKDNFENHNHYSVNLNWNLEDFFFEEEYYTFDSDGILLGIFPVDATMIEIQEKNFPKETFNGNYLKRASNRYLLAEGIAVAGATISLGLSQDNPRAAANVLAVSSMISYCIRISGHIALGKQTLGD